MRFILLAAYLIAFAWLFESHAQQNINNLTSKQITVNGKIEVNSTSQSSKPCPAMTEAQRDAIVSPVSGSCVYNTNTLTLNIYNGTIWKSAGGGISNWETAFNYALNDVVIESNKIYQCNTAHTSSVFSSDIANWTLISGVNVSEASGVLPMANGGTDKNLTPTLGGVVYTDANSMEVLGAGTDGQVLKSNGAAAPSWEDASNKVQGQDQAEVDFTKLQFKNKSVTETASGIQLIETDRNLLSNGSFEHTSYQTGWTTSGSATLSRETSVVRDGKASLKIVTAGNSFTVSQDSTLYAGQITGNGYVSVWIHNTAAGVQICSRNAGVDKDCQTALTNGIWHEYIVPVVFGATSNGVSIHSGTTAGTTYIDWARLVDIDATGSAPVIGPRVFYTPTTQGLGTVSPSTNGCSYSQIGSSILVECKVSGSSVSASELRIGLPSGMTIAGGFTGHRFFQNFVRDAAVGVDYTVIGKAGNTYLNFSRNITTTNSLVPQNADTLLGNSQFFSFSALVPIAELASSVPVYYDRCQDPRNCETVFSAKVSPTGVVSEENLDWINGNASISDTSLYALTFSSSLFSVTPNCTVTPSVSIGNLFPQKTSETSSGLSVRMRVTSTLANTVGAFDIICQRQGQDYLNAKVNQIVGSFKDYVKTPNTTTGKVGFCSAKISATGVISDQLGGCFASCTNAATPVCTFTSNYWKSGSVPNCWATSNDGAVLPGYVTGLSTTTFSHTMLNGALNPQAGARTYVCHGEIQ